MKQTLAVYNLHHQEINIDTIQYIEGQSNYSILHLLDRKPIVLSRSLYQFEDELPTFVRIHKKYLVNPQFVATRQTLTRKQLTLTLTSGEVLAVSRRRIPQVLLELAG